MNQSSVLSPQSSGASVASLRRPMASSSTAITPVATKVTTAATTTAHSPSEEEANKAAACEVAEKLNENISKVKGTVVVSSQNDCTKPSPGLLHKAEAPNLSKLLGSDSTVAPESDHGPFGAGAGSTVVPSTAATAMDNPSHHSNGISVVTSEKSAILNPAADDLHSPAAKSVPQPTQTSSGSNPASTSNVYPKLSSVHAHFLLDDVVHAASRSRSGSGSRERNPALFEKGFDNLVGPRRPTAAPIAVEDNNKPKSPPPLTGQIMVPAGPTSGINGGIGGTGGQGSISVTDSTASVPISLSNLVSPLLATSTESGLPNPNTSNTNTAGDPRLPQDDGKLHILLAATGSVSTGKLRLIINKLTDIYGRDRASIQIILTKPAENFLSRGEIPSHVRIWRDKDEWATWQGRADPVVHIELRRWADILVIAPLSANSLGKIALGLCDNLLTCVVRAWNTQYPILIAPAMVSYAYNHPATRAHLKVIKDEMKWIEVLKPVEKVVGSYGDIGMGGMMDGNEIVNKIVLKLGGYPEDEDEDEDENNDENNDETPEDNEDGDDGDDGDEAFGDAIAAESSFFSSEGQRMKKF